VLIFAAIGPSFKRELLSVAIMIKLDPYIPRIIQLTLMEQLEAFYRPMEWIFQ
jgi:hypothetical protein